MPKHDIILASASPRREELLSLIFKEFWVVPSKFDESKVPGDLSPAEQVVHSSLMKARDVSQDNPKSLVIGADTVVVVDEEILGKPRDRSDAARMLKLLSGRTHQVYTGITVIFRGKEHSGFECTDVTFSGLTDEVISRYISSGEPMDKAGAYAIQGRGAVLIESINGCYFNVVGLPVHKLSAILAELGMPPLTD
ncbi:MAG: Maf family protein [Armatimonadota bacterium]|nr:Maf family protein [bacterium]